jgi:hypothetical protein
MLLLLSLNGWNRCNFEQYPKCYILLNREIEAEESGIEGILNRLEKHRNNSFGRGFGEKEDCISSDNDKDKEKWEHRTTADGVSK